MYIYIYMYMYEYVCVFMYNSLNICLWPFGLQTSAARAAICAPCDQRARPQLRL